MHKRVNQTPFSLNVCCSLPAHGVTAIFGHSGSGKTTLLRCIAGLTQPQGRISIRDDVWQDEQTFVPVHKRSLGYVFQDSGLLPHLSVRNNLVYAFQRRVGSDNLTDAIDETTAFLGLASLLDQYPAQLSGGERQRVAIARAILPKPRLLLMDEPLASLDAARKAEILPYLDQLRQDFDIPILYVTHNVSEIARLADHVVVLENGTIADSGPVYDLLGTSPAFLHLGEETGSILQMTIAERDAEWHLMQATAGEASIWLRDTGDAIGAQVRLRILARDVSLAIEPPSETTILNRLSCQIDSLEADTDPAMTLVRLTTDDQRLLARITRKSANSLALAAGQPVWAQLKSVAVVR